MFEEEIYGIPKEWILLAELDESADYEVDITAIYKNGKDYILATASGCSCWDGIYIVEHFTTLNDLEKSLYDKDERKYNPSFKGAKNLVTEAKETLKKIDNEGLREKLELILKH